MEFTHILCSALNEESPEKCRFSATQSSRREKKRRASGRFLFLRYWFLEESFTIFSSSISVLEE